jgi:DNA-binding winged helix-turn-helix (wHTH) protein
VRRIRTALGDDARASRYVQTLPRRGYRFVAPVEAVRQAPHAFWRRLAQAVLLALGFRPRS